MALTPAAMMNLRRGPTMGPQPTPGGAAPPGAAPGAAPPAAAAGMPATPGMQSPGNLLMTAIAQRVNEQKKANAGFAVGNIDQTMRVVAATMVHLMQQHPEASRHLNRAWSSLDAAKKALNDAVKDQAMPLGPPLGFSGAAMGPTPAGPPGMGGGMGVPS
jgi:hypothetical protein